MIANTWQLCPWRMHHSLFKSSSLKTPSLMATSWIKLANIPKGSISNVLYHKNHPKPLIVITTRGNVLKYSLRDNSWEIYYSDITRHSKYHSDDSRKTVIDNKTNQIMCIHGRYFRKSLVKLDLNEDHEKAAWNTIIKKIKFGTTGSSLVMIKGELHIIGGTQNRKHLKWNENTKEFVILHDNVANRNHQTDILIHYSELVVLENHVIAFGAYDDPDCLDYIHEYDIINNSWKRLTITMPAQGMEYFGCATIMDGQYVLLFGGKASNELQNKIYIYSVKEKSFRESKVRCPKKGTCHAVAVRDKKEEELSVYGYVRYQWGDLQINQQLFPPRYLIQIMRRYYHVEYIHLFHSSWNVNLGHWKINVLDVIQD